MTNSILNIIEAECGPECGADNDFGSDAWKVAYDLDGDWECGIWIVDYSEFTPGEYCLLAREARNADEDWRFDEIDFAKDADGIRRLIETGRSMAEDLGI